MVHNNSEEKIKIKQPIKGKFCYQFYQLNTSQLVVYSNKPNESTDLDEIEIDHA